MTDAQCMYCLCDYQEYQQKIGLHKAQSKRRLWISRADLQQAFTELTSAKAPGSFGLQLHIDALFKILDRLLQLNGRRRVRSLRFSQHGLRQRVMYNICQRITAPVGEDEHPVVVAFGAGMFSSCSRGHYPGPAASSQGERS